MQPLILCLVCTTLCTILMIPDRVKLDSTEGATTPELQTTLGALETLLERLLPSGDAPPEALHRAMRHAVFPGGKRVRPRLLLTVAAACAASNGAMELALHAACALELVHCASLTHDDLPCFDDAPLRRGRPSVHALYGEAMAVLVGDALLCRAFEALAVAPPRLARRSLQILGRLTQATGSTQGIIGGQGLESAPLATTSPEHLERYHALKTASLFRLATEAGAIAAGSTQVAAWGQLGLELGLAYQLIDDLQDVRHDQAHGRPNAALSQGADAMHQRIQRLLTQVEERCAVLAVNPAPLHAFLARPELRGAPSAG